MPIVPVGETIRVNGTIYRAGEEYPEVEAPKETKKPKKKEIGDAPTSEHANSGR